MSNLKITRCEGEGQGSCAMCEGNGRWNRTWMCFLYEIEGFEGCYCPSCVEKIRAADGTRQPDGGAGPAPT